MHAAWHTGHGDLPERTIALGQLLEQEGVSITYHPMTGRLRAVIYGANIILDKSLVGVKHDYWLAKAIECLQTGQDGICLDSEVLQL